jgi:hypothetical protein
LHLTLKDVFKTHKQTLTVNNQNIRITIPAGVQDGQAIKMQVTEHQAEMSVRMAIYTSLFQ